MERYEHLGEVKVWIQDMHPVWQEKREAVKVTFPAEKTWWTDDIDIDMPRERVWDYLIQPEFRNSLIGTDRMEISNSKDGRIAPGSVYQCYHGDNVVPQTVLEWQPFESMLLKELFPMNHNVSYLAEYRLQSIESGARLTREIAYPEGPLFGRTMLRVMSLMFKPINRRLFNSFKTRIEEDYRSQGELPDSKDDYSEKQLREAAAAGLQASTGSQEV
jgi:uncharacterized protein YndB with AHSA1/START domain